MEFGLQTGPDPFATSAPGGPWWLYTDDPGAQDAGRDGFWDIKASEVLGAVVGMFGAYWAAQEQDRERSGRARSGASGGVSMGMVVAAALVALVVWRLV